VESGGRARREGGGEAKTRSQGGVGVLRGGVSVREVVGVRCAWRWQVCGVWYVFRKAYV